VHKRPQSKVAQKLLESVTRN